MHRERVMLVEAIVFTAYATACLCGAGAAHAQTRDGETPVHFTDPALKAAVEEALGVSNPTPKDMLALYSLDAWLSELGVADLTGINYATNLTTLRVPGGRITDVSPLSGLTKLSVLDLRSHQIRGISPLAKLKNLKRLYLSGNDIDDLSPLTGLTNLWLLELEQINTNDLSPLANLRNLTHLYLAYDEIRDLSPLRNVTSLSFLELTTNSVSDLSPLAQLKNLTYIGLSSNQVSDISALTELPHLEDLSLSSNLIRRLPPLGALRKLKYLGISYNAIQSLGPLADLTNLNMLYADGCGITDVSALAGLVSLEELHLNDNQITALDWCSGLTNLRFLDARYNRIRSCEGLAGLANLKQLLLDDNGLRNIDAVRTCVGLEEVWLRYNWISDISALSALTNLQDVDLTGNSLNCDAYCVHIPMIRNRNPRVVLSFDPQPASCVCTPATHKIYYVDMHAQGTNDGSSWANAFDHLQDALEAARYGEEIRVAQGVYRPDQKASGVRPGDRQATFQLKNSVAIKGGYAGVTAQDPNSRSVDEYLTTLSGDLAGNDVGPCGDSSMNENSLHVVRGDDTDNGAVLDGFTISGGMANLPSEESGGGMTIYSGAPTIRECRFLHNYARSEGGGLWYMPPVSIYDIPSSHIVNCVFTDNHAGSLGGAIRTQYPGWFGCTVCTGASFPPLTLEHCRITGNTAGSAGGGISGGDAPYNSGIQSCLALRECVFIDNSAEREDEIEHWGCRVTSNWFMGPDLILADLIISPYDSQVATIGDATVSLEGDVNLPSGRVDIISSLFEGKGTIVLGREARLRFAGHWQHEPITTVRTSMSGLGQIEIDAGQQLILEGDAVVNLSSSLGGFPDPDRDGHIVVNGSLVVRGNATIESTNIDVKLLEVDDPNIIQYNNITLLEASTGFGGEFFVGENARITNNSIVSEGDRYLDLDPKPKDSKHPTIQNNRITVVIKEGKLGRQGTLLELRAKDYDAGTAINPVGSSGTYQVPGTSAGFTKDPCANWVLEKLILEPNSKLNLTNRQGFEFQSADDRYPETVYVKELVLGPNSVLNTALQTLYYQRLVDPNGMTLARNPTDRYAPLANGARFEDIPLLGFSLGVIAMNDPMEFDIRVRQRLTDPADDSKQPPTPAEALYIGSITRIDASLNPAVPTSNGGVMEMGTQAPNKQSARSVAAKGAFARAGEEQITVEFEYQFREHPDPDTELIVYLSDNAEVSKGKLLRVATIRPPDSSRPGSARSGRFAVFSGMFSRADLDFHRGTYVELELRGRAACCWIDNWDPKIECGAPKCGDYNNDGWIDMTDFLMLLAEMGPADPSRPDRRCLDLVGDGCVGTDDLLLWDSSVFNLCPGKAVSTISPAAVSALRPPFLTAASTGGTPSVPLVVFGKSGDRTGYRTALKSQLYRLSSQGLCLGSDLAVGNGRLFTDRYGTIYQIQNGRGIIRTDTGQTVVPERQNLQYLSSGFWISLGSGSPLLDAAFDPADAKTLYVVPVQVQGPGGTVPYPAAAKLRLNSASPHAYTVEALYGVDPAQDPNQKNDPNATYCQDLTRFDYEPDTQHLREIEVDGAGRVYVLSSLIRESQNATSRHNWILIYDRDQPNRWQSVSLNDLDLAGPVALVVSKAGDRLYLTSTGAAANADPNGLTTQVFCFSLKTRADGRLNVALDRTLAIVGPVPAMVSIGASNLVEPDRFVCLVTSMTEDPVTGTLYAAGFTAPKFTDRLWQAGTVVGFFTQPILAEIPKGAQGMIRAETIDDPNPDHPLLLPLSIVWSPGK